MFVTMRRMLSVFLFSLLLFFTVLGVFFIDSAKAASAKTPELEWTHNFEKGEGHFVEQTKDGGYILTGWTESRQEGSDVFLAKCDRDGNRLWMKTYQGNGYSDSHCVQEVKGGGFIIVGETKSKYGYDHDVYVVRTDEKGGQLWSKTFGGTHCDYAWAVQQTKDGGFIVAGGTESYGAGIYDVYLIKLDSAGNEIWEKTYGGTGSDCAYAVRQLDDGGYLVAGNTESFGAVKPDVYLLRTDGNGKMLWQKTYGGKGSDYGWSLLKDEDGGYLIAGEKEIVSDPGGGFAAYLIKTDQDGNKLWEKTYAIKSGSSFYAISQANDGGFIQTGKKESTRGGYDLYVVKTDRNGALVWEKTIAGSGSNSGYRILQAKDGSYAVVGKKGIAKSSGSDILLLKLQSESNRNISFLLSLGITAAFIVAASTTAYLYFKRRKEKEWLD